VHVASAEPIIDLNISSFAPTEFLELLRECCELDFRFRIALWRAQEHANPALTFGFLGISR